MTSVKSGVEMLLLFAQLVVFSCNVSSLLPAICDSRYLFWPTILVPRMQAIARQRCKQTVNCQLNMCGSER